MIAQVKPKVTLVGAGPGDPELITLKAVFALNKADVVLYDALVDKSLLKHAPDKALKIFVGKRAGKHSVPQDETNRLCVENALKHGHVVRLKGGDPFVFGRGSEEIDYIEAFGIPTEVISGICSAISVPAAVGIPVTKRKVSESFWVITGTTTAGKLSSDISLAAKSTATVVILMGIRKLPEIISIFQREGKHQLPIAVIQNGTTKEEQIYAGYVSDILEKMAHADFTAASIIVIGDVVKESYQLKECYQQFLGVEI